MEKIKRSLNMGKVIVTDILTYEISKWSNYAEVIQQLKERLGDMVFKKIVIIEPRKGYMEFRISKHCYNRVTEVIQYEMPLKEMGFNF